MYVQAQGKGSPSDHSYADGPVETAGNKPRLQGREVRTESTDGPSRLKSTYRTDHSHQASLRHYQRKGAHTANTQRYYLRQRQYQPYPRPRERGQSVGRSAHRSVYPDPYPRPAHQRSRHHIAYALIERGMALGGALDPRSSAMTEQQRDHTFSTFSSVAVKLLKEIVANRSPDFPYQEAVATVGMFVANAWLRGELQTAFTLCKQLYQHHRQHRTGGRCSRLSFERGPGKQVKELVQLALEAIAMRYCYWAKEDKRVAPQLISEVVSFIEQVGVECIQALRQDIKQKLFLACVCWHNRALGHDFRPRLLDKLPYSAIRAPVSDEPIDIATALEARMHWLQVAQSSLFCPQEWLQTEADVVIVDFSGLSLVEQQVELRLHKAYLNLRLHMLRSKKETAAVEEAEACARSLEQELMDYRRAGPPYSDSTFQEVIVSFQLRTLVEHGYIVLRNEDFDGARRFVQDIYRIKSDSRDLMHGAEVLDARILRKEVETCLLSGMALSKDQRKLLEKKRTLLRRVVPIYHKAAPELAHYNTLLDESDNVRLIKKNVDDLIHQEQYEDARVVLQDNVSKEDEYVFYTRKSQVLRQLGFRERCWQDKVRYYGQALDLALKAAAHPLVEKQAAWSSIHDICRLIDNGRMNPNSRSRGQNRCFLSFQAYKDRLPVEIVHCQNWYQAANRAKQLRQKNLKNYLPRLGPGHAGGSKQIQRQRDH